MSNYKTHALQEFKAAGWLNEDGTFKDDMQRMICEHVLELLVVFDGEGHSGTSAPYAVDLFKKLAMFEPVAPLTGEDWEWRECTGFGSGEGFDGIYQNKRCSRVFKQAGVFGGQAYDDQGIVFFTWVTDEETGEKYRSSYTCRDSRVPIVFPYTPEIKYVEAPPES